MTSKVASLLTYLISQRSWAFLAVHLGPQSPGYLGILRYCCFNRQLTFSYLANMKITASIYWELTYVSLYTNNFHIHCGPTR